jgi:hypothetical protein
MEFNPYKVLAIDPSADTDVLAAVYRTLSKKYHPDINKSPGAEIRMREINRAYEMLKDPEQRRKVDAELAREAATKAASSYVPPRPAPSRRPATPSSRPGGPDWGNLGDQLRRGFESTVNNLRSEVHPNAPDGRTLYFYQKQLSDEAQGKLLKIAVYHDGPSNRKLCNIQVSSPNGRGQITSGEVFLDAAGLFDLTLSMTEAERMLQEPASPLEMNADHDVYFRQAVAGLGHTYIGVEVIKKSRSNSKEALLLLGEKNARTEKDGVVSEQSPKQLQQIGRIFQTALQSMR